MTPVKSPPRYAPKRRPLRADAARNRAKVVAAAAEVFGQAGIDASIIDVAERAGVGKATIYRSFPSKEHLMCAVACERLARFQRLAQAALRETDAWAAFCELLAAMAETQASDRILVEALASACELPELTTARQATLAAVGKVMRKAQRQGSMRADATVQDLRILFAGAAHMLNQAGEHDAAVWRRYGSLIAAGLRRPSP